MALKTEVTLSITQQIVLFSITPSGPVKTNNKPNKRPIAPPTIKGTMVMYKVFQIAKPQPASPDHPSS